MILRLEIEKIRHTAQAQDDCRSFQSQHSILICVNWKPFSKPPPSISFLTFSISPLFLLRGVRENFTVTAESSPCRFRANRSGCRGLKEISSSGRGNLERLPVSVEISDESSTSGQLPDELCDIKIIIINLIIIINGLRNMCIYS